MAREYSYFCWLVERVSGDVGRCDYLILLDFLDHQEFTWSVSNDDNRAGDGLALRDVYTQETGYFPNRGGACSVLEMLVALADRMSYYADGDWFWEMIENLGLLPYNDSNFYDDKYVGNYSVSRILVTFLGRKYLKNGTGGLFPLQHTRKDQRRVELWYQMCEYLEEKVAF